MFDSNKKPLFIYPAIALFALSANILVAEEMVKGYVKSSSGEVYKNRFGECWRTNYKDTTEKLEECGYEAEAPVVEPVVAAPVTEEVIYENIAIKASLLFDLNSSALSASAKSLIDEGVDRFTAKPATIEHISIIGHTDSTGTEAYNQALSERRAKSVGDYLVNEKGLAVEQVATSGKGESEPAVSNATRAGRIENRRVEIQIPGKKTAE